MRGGGGGGSGDGGGENGGGLYIGRRGARGLGEGAKPEAAAASCSRRTPAAWGRGRERAGWPGFGWASAQSGKRVFFFKIVPRKILHRKINKNRKNTK